MGFVAPSSTERLRDLMDTNFRRLGQGPKGRVERPSFYDKPLIVETRSPLRAPVETTERSYANVCPPAEEEEVENLTAAPRVRNPPAL
jgi:hypothetical protein